MSRQIVILAAGKGTRMEVPIPKVLVLLHEKPVIKHLLEQVAQVPDIGTPILVVGYKHEEVRAALGDQYIYALQTEQLGTGHAVQYAQSFVTADNMLVLYGDMPLVKTESILKLIELHEQNGAAVSMFTTQVPDFEDVYSHFRGFGRIIREHQYHTIQKITEFKDATDEEKKILEVNPGIYMFNTLWLWPNLKRITNQNAQGEFYLTDIIELAIRDGYMIHSLRIDPSEVYGINTQEHLRHAHSLINPWLC